jgi:uncharacterized glyoxalase superfamily protein PhnB
MSTVLTPYLMVTGGAEAIDFYTRAFGAAEVFRLTGADGHIGHAEMRVAEATFMLSDESPEVVPTMRGPSDEEIARRMGEGGYTLSSPGNP